MKKIVFIFHSSAFKIGMLIALFTISAMIIIAILMGNEAGSFVVRVQNTDTDRSIALTESMDKDKYKLLPRLNAGSKDNMTDCSPRYFLDQDYKTIRDNFYKQDGLYKAEFLEESVYAYSFYLVNDGRTTVGVDMKMTCSNITRQLDEVIRVMTYYEIAGNQYVNVYQKADTVEYDYQHYSAPGLQLHTFKDAYTIFDDQWVNIDSQKGNNSFKFMVLIWLEGQDPDSEKYGSSLYNGTMNFEIDFKVSMNH